MHLPEAYIYQDNTISGLFKYGDAEESEVCLGLTGMCEDFSFAHGLV